MTKQDVEKQLTIPDIVTEEDAPFGENSNRFDNNLGISENIDDEILRFKYKTGKEVLYFTMISMIILAIFELILSKFGFESDLIKNAFEALKLISMTSIGYILGTNTSK